MVRHKKLENTSKRAIGNAESEVLHMAFISPALVARIYKALGQNLGCDAVLLLRQHQFERGHAGVRDNELLDTVINMANLAYGNGEIAQSEEHFKLGLALYDACFKSRHVDALRCLSGILAVLEKQDRWQESFEYLNRYNEVLNILNQPAPVPSTIAV